MLFPAMGQLIQSTAHIFLQGLGSSIYLSSHPILLGTEQGLNPRTPAGTSGSVCATVTAGSWLLSSPHAWDRDAGGKHWPGA